MIFFIIPVIFINTLYALVSFLKKCLFNALVSFLKYSAYLISSWILNIPDSIFKFSYILLFLKK